MPFLDKIIENLNKHWQTSSLKFIPKAKIKVYGIAETTLAASESEEGKTIKYPSTIDNDGEVTMIAIDDTYQLVMYHRLESITNSQAAKGFGDSRGDMLEVANLALIVYAFKDKIRKSAHHLEALLKDAIPEDTKITVDSKVVQTSLFKVGNSSFDKLGLLTREFTEVEVNYPNLIAFEMKYRIESTWRKGCNTCGC